MSFYNRMMNIAVDPVAMSSAHKPGSLHLAYKIGHKDARHAAAEIANEADAEIARLLETVADYGAGAALLRVERDELHDILRQWKYAEDNNDRDELANARTGRDEALVRLAA